MKLTAAIQEALLSVICYDDSPQGSVLVRSMLTWKSFDPYFRDIAEAAYDYIDQYGKPPGDHTIDLIDSLKERKSESAAIYDRIFTSMEDTQEDLNVEYVVKQAAVFARQQRIKRGLTESIDLLERDESESGLDRVQGVLTQALEGSSEYFNPGIILSDAAQSLTFLDRERSAYPTGIKQLDQIDGGPARKRLHLFMALPKRGKSWWLVHLSKAALMHGLRVVYVTLELSEEEVAQRMLQSLFSISKRDQSYRRQVFKEDELGRIINMDSKAIRKRPFLAHKGIRSLLTRKMKALKRRPPLVIKEFPTGALTVPELEAYLGVLEGAKGIIPDLLIVDYADLMTTSTDNYRLDLGQIYKNLRGLAVKRNIAVATASQAHRQAGQARVVTESHAAEDFSKIATADLVITYSQTPEEKQLGLARLFVAVSRTDEDKITVLVSQQYGLGQFCMDSVRMVSTYWDLLESQGDHD